MLAAQNEFGGACRTTSGRYEYKNWATASDGSRIAIRAYRRVGEAYNDLINTAYVNPDGSRTVYGIAFDFDVERAEERWKDEAGCLSWSRISAALEKDHPQILSYLTHVTRSSGGKGFGIVLSIAPLPIQFSTQKNQTSALQLQSRLISLFNEYGFGADPGARGIQRDLPNFNDPSRMIHRNEITKRRIEKNKEAVVSKLHAYLNEVDQEKKLRTRLYPDARVEEKLAILFLWLVGEYKPNSKLVRTPLFLSCDSVTASTQQICRITGASEKFLRNFFAHPPEWLKTAYIAREGWEISLAITKEFSTLWERSKAFVSNSHFDLKTSSLKVRDLKLPWLVTDGERNAWLTSLALLYKWHGYSEDAAKEKIAIRLKEIPGYTHSRNCKQIKSIVKSIYSRMPETFGMHSFRDLPDWIRDDKIFCSKLGRINHRRGVTPCVLHNHGNINSQNLLTPTKLHAFSTLFEDKVTANEIDNYVQQANKHNEVKTHRRLTVIRFKQRVAVFDGDDLLLCLTKKHYVASKILEYLQTLNRYKDNDLRLVSPKKYIQKLFYERVENAPVCISAAQLCGFKKSAREKFSEWADKRGIIIETKSQISDDEIPF